MVVIVLVAIISGDTMRVNVNTVMTAGVTSLRRVDMIGMITIKLLNDCPRFGSRGR